MSKQKIYIYNGPGVSEICLMNTAFSLKQALPKSTIKTILPDEVLRGEWRSDANLFILPGGADLPYVKHLTPNGNAIIKDYVNSGGFFLGICAGAYYASSAIEFAVDSSNEITQRRDLAFFPGIAKGPFFKQYDYQSEAGAHAARLIESKTQQKFSIFYNGGCGFLKSEEDENTEILAKYEEINLPAIIKIKYGSGTCILSGVHPEYSSDLLNRKDQFLAEVYNELKDFEIIRMEFFSRLLNLLGLK